MAFQPSPHILPTTPKPVPAQAPTAAPIHEAFLPEVTLDLTGLPSRGLPYGGAKSLKYRGYCFGEVKKVSGETGHSIGDGLNLVLSGVTCSFDPLDLTLADALFIGLLRKISTFGSDKVFRAEYLCRCGAKNSSTVRREEVEFEDLAIQSLPIKAQFSFGSVKFHPITVREFIRLSEMGKADDEIAMLALQSDMEFNTAHDRFSKVTGQDMAILKRVDDYLFHGLKPIHTQCVKCKTMIEVELDGGQALILPFRGPESTIEDCISFGD